MSSNRRKKRGIQEISQAPPAAVPPRAVLAPVAPPSLLKDILWKIVQYSPNHRRLRLVSSDWNQAVIDAHCESECICKECSCTSSLSQFHTKRLLLPWITKWDFKIESTTSQALLTEMMYRRQYPGGPQVSRIPSTGRPISPITKCSVTIGESNYRDAELVFSSSQMQHLKELTIHAIKQTIFSAEGRQQFIAALPNLDQLENLKIIDLKFDYHGNVGQQAFQRIIKSAPNLTICTIKGCGLNDEALSVFSSCPSIVNLKELYIQYNPTISAAGVRDCIASSPFLTNLRVLNLFSSNVGDAAVTAICQSASLTQLQTLWLGFCSLTDASIAAMIASDNMKSVERFSIAGNPMISASGLASLLASASKANSAFSKVTGLNVHSLRAFQGLQFSEEVTSLFPPLSIGDSMLQRKKNLLFKIGRESSFDEQAVAALARLPLMNRVHELHLSCSTDIAPSLLFSPSSQFTALTFVDIQSPKITWLRLADLANSPLCQQIQILSLGATEGAVDIVHFERHLDDDCCKLLADSTNLHQLKTLNLSKPHLSVSVGLIMLLSSCQLSSLTHLDCDWDATAPYVTAETMNETEAASEIIQLLKRRSNRIEYLKFPNTAFAAAVRKLVKEEVRLVEIK